jgi:hypothetical protein
MQQPQLPQPLPPSLLRRLRLRLFPPPPPSLVTLTPVANGTAVMYTVQQQRRGFFRRRPPPPVTQNLLIALACTSSPNSLALRRYSSLPPRYSAILPASQQFGSPPARPRLRRRPCVRFPAPSPTLLEDPRFWLPRFESRARCLLVSMASFEDPLH